MLPFLRGGRCPRSWPRPAGDRPPPPRRLRRRGPHATPARAPRPAASRVTPPATGSCPPGHAREPPPRRLCANGSTVASGGWKSRPPGASISAPATTPASTPRRSASSRSPRSPAPPISCYPPPSSPHRPRRHTLPGPAHQRPLARVAHPDRRPPPRSARCLLRPPPGRPLGLAHPIHQPPHPARLRPPHRRVPHGGPSDPAHPARLTPRPHDLGEWARACATDAAPVIAPALPGGRPLPGVSAPRPAAPSAAHSHPCTPRRGSRRPPAGRSVAAS